MKFIKDLLIVEIETTGDDSDKDPIIQLAGLLLDKDNLLEKGIFNSYIRTSLLEGTLREQGKRLGVDLSVMRSSPKHLEAMKKFAETFKHPVTLTLQNVKHFLFLRNAFKKVSLPFPFDYQMFELWTIEYLYCQRLGYKKIPTLDTLIDYYKLPVKNYYNALERARLEAEVLRRILKSA